jgi:hypothetical protein
VLNARLPPDTADIQIEAFRGYCATLGGTVGLPASLRTTRTFGQRGLDPDDQRDLREQLIVPMRSPEGSRSVLTASVDEIVAVDDKARALNIKAEISQAKIKAFGQELDCVERERARWVGVDMPTDAELKQLLALVERAHPRLLDRDPNAYIVRNVDDEFKRAFYGVSSITRLAEPTQKIAFSTHVDRLNDLLRRRGHAEVEGDVVFAAAIAWGDVDYRLQDMRYGQVAEVSLDPLHNTGRAPSPVWREILAGKPLRKASPPRMVADRTIGLVRTVGG